MDSRRRASVGAVTDFEYIDPNPNDTFLTGCLYWSPNVFFHSVLNWISVQTKMNKREHQKLTQKSINSNNNKLTVINKLTVKVDTEGIRTSLETLVIAILVIMCIMIAIIIIVIIDDWVIIVIK